MGSRLIARFADSFLCKKTLSEPYTTDQMFRCVPLKEKRQSRVRISMQFDPLYVCVDIQTLNTLGLMQDLMQKSME
jgi:hypothetical protein